MQPTRVLLPGKSHGQRNLVGYIQSMWSQKSQTGLSDSTATTRSLVKGIYMCRFFYPSSCSIVSIFICILKMLLHFGAIPLISEN